MLSESIAYGSTGISPDEGLPPFTPQHLSYPQVNTKCNLSYQVQVAEFQLLDGVHSLHTPQPSIVQRIANGETNTSEDLVLMIQMVLIETIASVDLRGKLYVERGSFIVDDCWNIVVVRRPGGAEAAVFAVVTDDIDVTSVEDSWVQAQVLDYLVKMASYSGQKYTFGGVTNYQQWRFCCLPDTEELAVSDKLTLPDRDEHHVSFFTSSRGVTSSQVYPFNSPDLVYALETLLLRAYFSPVVPRASLATHTSMYLDITQDRWQWNCMSGRTAYSLFFPNTRSPWYTLLYHIDSTYDQGNLWLARTDTGAIVTLKFPTHAQRSCDWNASVSEAATWDHVWGVGARTVVLLDAVALEIPVIYHCVVTGGTFVGFRGLIPITPDTTEQAPIAQELMGLTAQLRRLADDPLGIARAALSHLVLHRGLCLRDDDVKWSNIGVIPQAVQSGHPVQEIDEQDEGQEGRVNQVTVRLVPVVTELSRLQVVTGGPERAQASLTHMLELLEVQFQSDYLPLQHVAMSAQLASQDALLSIGQALTWETERDIESPVRGNGEEPPLADELPTSTVSIAVYIQSQLTIWITSHEFDTRVKHILTIPITIVYAVYFLHNFDSFVFAVQWLALSALGAVYYDVYMTNGNLFVKSICRRCGWIRTREADDV